ncbi:MAG TPA: hypothetical protein DIS76_00770 [Rhodospirillaceae bacterium]|nr:hypothetical protein [Rhodospirillaceae bacterium]
MSQEILKVLKGVVAYSRYADIPLSAVKGYLEECKGQSAEQIADDYAFMVYNPGRALWAAVAIGDEGLISEVSRLVETIVAERPDMVLPSTLTMILQAAEQSGVQFDADKILLGLNKDQVGRVHELYERHILGPMKGWNSDQVNDLAERMIKAANDTRTQTYVAGRLPNAVAMLGHITGQDLKDYKSIIEKRFDAHKGQYGRDLGHPHPTHTG